MFSPTSIAYSSQGNKMFDPLGLFGPLDKNYCLFFFIISAFSLVLFVIALITLVGELITGKTTRLYLTAYIMIMYFILYFQSRIFYNMCANSL